MTPNLQLERPSSFVSSWVPRLADRLPQPRRALDIAMGRGRHAGILADAGFKVFGVDKSFEVIQDACRTAGHDRRVFAWCADLTVYPLPRERFDLILVTRYLQRDLFPSLRDAIAPGAFVLYETFTEAQRALGCGPSSPHHLLRAGELRAFFQRWEILQYDELVETDAAVARLVARKPSA
jgi:2-polyprenyl-3-methyl-5-hydroxy-6-metoxy-1,4-benzoquinol methylase